MYKVLLFQNDQVTNFTAQTTSLLKQLHHSNNFTAKQLHCSNNFTAQTTSPLK
jgi:hypothetical protein